MSPFLYPINIGTLALWLSAAGFGVAGLIIPDWRNPTPAPPAMEPRVIEEFTLGDVEPIEDPAVEPNDEPAEPAEPALATTLMPPELPLTADLPPLPELPSLPAPVVKPAETPPPAKPRPRPAPSGSTTRPGNPTATANRGPSQPASGPVGMSNSARLAAGKMAAPSYPPTARRNGQTGTVMVEFTVDASGRVVAARARSSSGFPLLDNEAVRTVRSWRFPPGGVMTLQRPIIFQLR